MTRPAQSVQESVNQTLDLIVLDFFLRNYITRFHIAQTVFCTTQNFVKTLFDKGEIVEYQHFAFSCMFLKSHETFVKDVLFSVLSELKASLRPHNKCG